MQTTKYFCAANVSTAFLLNVFVKSGNSPHFLEKCIFVACFLCPYLRMHSKFLFRVFWDCVIIDNSKSIFYVKDVRGPGTEP